MLCHFKHLNFNRSFFKVFYSKSTQGIMGMIKHYSLEDADIFIFDHYLIIQIHEGVTVEAPHDKEINKIVHKHFAGKDMVYISNRVKSYTVDPLIYPRVELIPNMLAIAIVPKTAAMRKSAEFESAFYDKPFKIFDSLTAAIKWVDTLIS